MCFYVALGLIAPRLVLLGLWLFRSAWIAVLQPWYVGVFGWLLAPFTTLAYTLIHAQAGHVGGTAHWIIIALAIFMDVGAWGGSSRRRK